MTAHVYHLTVPEARVLKSRGQQGRLLGVQGCLSSPFQLQEVPVFLGSRPLPPLLSPSAQAAMQNAHDWMT